jgi:hypothetical protein
VAASNSRRDFSSKGRIEDGFIAPEVGRIPDRSSERSRHRTYRV